MQLVTEWHVMTIVVTLWEELDHPGGMREEQEALK
jgi:hypothetical protein